MDAPVALITGGLGDLAQALHVELTGQGYAVHAPGRTEMDVTSSTSVEAFVSGLEALDLLVCNAGVCRDASMLKMEEMDFDQVLDTCLSGAFRAARAALNRMSGQCRGHIVFIGSFSGWRGPAGQANYAAAKAGLMGLTQSLAAEYGARNIRVNCVLPGFMETRMTAGLGEDLKRSFLAAHTLGRFNTTQEVSCFIAHLDRFLLHTSGQIFNLDSRLNRSA